MGASKSAAALLLLCFMCIAQQCIASLMAVDLGSEFLKVSIIKPGRAPISIVTNEISKRKTTAAVSFVNGERLLGEQAAALSARFPDRVYTRARDLLGKSFSHPSVQAMLSDNMLPFTIVEDPDRHTVRLQTHTGDSYSAEEIVASMFLYAKRIAEAQSSSRVTDVVCVVPAWFSPDQRTAMADAVRLAGMSPLTLVNGHASAALQYGIERDFKDAPQKVVFLDVGSGSTEAALVSFSSYRGKGDQGKRIDVNQLEVLDVAFDADLGGFALDAALMKHFAEDFAAKHGTGGITGNARAMGKLRRAARRSKEVLSANQDAPCVVEELADGIDYFGSVSRATFEGLAGDFFDRVGRLVSDLLARNGVEVEELDAVEMLGGTSRVPAVQAAVSKALGGRGLDRHLDSDEAPVLGAGLVAANMSSMFRMRQFGMWDGAVFPLQVQVGTGQSDDGAGLEGADGEEGAEEAAGAAALYRRKKLLPRMKRLEAKRAVNLPNITDDPLEVTVYYDDSVPLPPAVDDPVHSRYQVTGLGGVAEQTGGPTGKVSLHFLADSAGWVTLQQADAAVMLTEEVEVLVPDEAAEEDGLGEGTAGEAEGTAPAAAGAEGAGVDGGSGGEAEAEVETPPTEKPEDGAQAPKQKAKAPIMKTVKEEQTALKKLPLTITRGAGAVQGLTEAQTTASLAVLAALAEADFVREDTAEAKNDLEAYIIGTREKLGEDEGLRAASTEESRTAFGDALTAMEDWLYMEGDAETGEVYRQKLGELRAVGDPIARRAAEAETRPKAVEEGMRSLELMEMAVNVWPEMRPWLGKGDVANVAGKLETYRTWLEEAVAAQMKLAPHEDPAFSTADVTAKLQPAEKMYKRLERKPKPAPPPEEAEAETEGGADAPAREADPGKAAADDATPTEEEGEAQAGDPHDEL